MEAGGSPRGTIHPRPDSCKGSLERACDRTNRRHRIMDGPRRWVALLMVVAAAGVVLPDASWSAAEGTPVLVAQSSTQQQTPAGSASPASNSTTRSQKPSHQLLRLHLDEKPQFQSGRLSNPSAGAGYSDSATLESRRMLEEYLHSHSAGSVIQMGGSEAECSRLQLPGAESTAKKSVIERQGTSLLACRQFQTAANIFSEGLRRYPHSEELREGLGISLFSAGKIDDSVRVLIAASDDAPSDPTPYLFLTRACRLSHSEQPAAVARLRRFATLQPRNPRALYEYATVLWTTSARTPTATSHVKQLLIRAVQLNPNDARIRLALGRVYAQQRSWPRAISEFKQAIELDPALTVCHYQLALAYARSGQKVKAQAEMAAYQRLRAKGDQRSR
jgi:Flp pilus assembly protein TadD